MGSELAALAGREPGAENGFDVEKYIRHSRKVDISDLDLSRAADYPLTEDEVRCLTYMMDIEGHTIVYLKSILNTCAIRDPQTTAFLSCWAYEEFFHSYTLRQFLDAAGVTVSANRIAEVQLQASWRVWVEQMVASLICQMSKHFHAVYLTWGAISELTTLEGYGVLAGRTRNPLLSEILRRLAKDERRHFSFYYNKAKAHLQPKNAQRLTKFILQKFWMPVGEGVKPDSEVEWIGHYILGDAPGAPVAARIDETIARLPGMAWFRGLTATRDASLQKPCQAVPAMIAHGNGERGGLKAPSGLSRDQRPSFSIWLKPYPDTNHFAVRHEPAPRAAILNKQHTAKHPALYRAAQILVELTFRYSSAEFPGDTHSWPMS